MAVTRALVYIAWEETLERAEQPPKRLWLDEEGLAEWFREVRRKRKEKYGGGDDGWDHRIEDPVQNEYAAELKRKMRGR